MENTYDLERFVTAQMEVYAAALTELKNGRKETHWMWYIFPQLSGLGHSATAKYYGISGLEEAQQYLRHPLLGSRLRECCEALLALGNVAIVDVLGSPDNLKLCSCMTLFECAADDPSVFTSVLVKFYHGQRDLVTLEMLSK